MLYRSLEEKNKDNLLKGTSFGYAIQHFHGINVGFLHSS